MKTAPGYLISPAAVVLQYIYGTYVYLISVKIVTADKFLIWFEKLVLRRVNSGGIFVFLFFLLIKRFTSSKPFQEWEKG